LTGCAGRTPGAKEWKYGNESSNRNGEDERQVEIAGESGRGRAVRIRSKRGLSWKEFTRFLSDVRGEMRKVVTPSRKEVEATTTVVIIAVFIFGLFFFVVDWIFHFGLTSC
jgi:preprotein translocase SecE subunit